MIIKKVLQRKDGMKYVIIPKDADISKNDYVKINIVSEVSRA